MVSLEYSDVLADILGRKHSKCICPVEYLARLKEQEPKQQPKGECRFGPNCNFVTTCHFEAAKCTCHPQCTCGLEIPPSLVALQPTDPARSRMSRESGRLLTDLSAAQLNCDQIKCTCTECICRPQKSQPELFPLCFQNAIKSQVRNKVCDDLMKRECEEIKQLIKEHKQSEEIVKPNAEKPHSEKEVKMASDSSTKVNDEAKPCLTESEIRSLGKSKKGSLQTPNESSEVKMASDSSTKVNDEAKPSLTESEIRSLGKSKKGSLQTPNESSEVKMASDSSTKVNDEAKPSLTESEIRSLGKSKKGSLQTPNESSDKKRTTESHRGRKSGSDVESHASRKETKCRRSTAAKKLYPAKTKSIVGRTNYYCGCKDYPKRRPPRIRYYYDGGSTDCYRSKVGHKNCVVPPVSVPKHMGWLWNKEDPSKGIRERQGWPPGFIGKTIKSMMRVIKSFKPKKEEAEEAEEAEGTKEEEKAEKIWWKSIEFTYELAPEVEEPPLLHIHRQGRTCNINFCPKESDEDISPIPIPFSITEKKRDDDSSTTDSSLEIELHLLKPKKPKWVRKIVSSAPKTISPSPSIVEIAASSTKQDKKKQRLVKKKRFQGSEENKTNWEEQQTLMQKNKQRLVKKKRFQGSEENKNNWEEQQTLMQNIT